MHVVPLPALADNYIWLIHNDAGEAVVVDPGEAAPVEEALRDRGLRLRAILLTHHHADHIGGAAALQQSHHATIYAPHEERINLQASRVAEGDSIRIEPLGLSFTTIEVPAHTRSHIAFIGAGMLFCGDTLFSLGCGRLFEGSAEQLLAALDRFATLPPETLVYAAHEYTAANGRFAVFVDPDNPELAERLTEVANLRRRDLPSLPVSLASELATNPFLRIDQPALCAWAERQRRDATRVERLALLRAAKDNFQG